MRRQLSGGDPSDAVVVVDREVTRETCSTLLSQVDPLMLFIFRAPDTVGHERGGDSWCLHGAVFSAAIRVSARACVRARLHVYRLTLDPTRQVAGSGVAEDKITILGKLKNFERLCGKKKK